MIWDEKKKNSSSYFCRQTLEFYTWKKLEFRWQKTWVRCKKIVFRWQKRSKKKKSPKNPKNKSTPKKHPKTTQKISKKSKNNSDFCDLDMIIFLRYPLSRFVPPKSMESHCNCVYREISKYLDHHPLRTADLWPSPSSQKIQTKTWFQVIFFFRQKNWVEMELIWLLEFFCSI